MRTELRPLSYMERNDSLDVQERATSEISRMREQRSTQDRPKRQRRMTAYSLFRISSLYERSVEELLWGRQDVTHAAAFSSSRRDFGEIAESGLERKAQVTLH